MSAALQEIASASVATDVSDALTRIRQKQSNVRALSREGKSLLKSEIMMKMRHTEESLARLDSEATLLNELEAGLSRGRAVLDAGVLDAADTALDVERVRALSEASAALLRVAERKHVVFEKTCACRERLVYMNERAAAVLDDVAASESQDADSVGFYA